MDERTTHILLVDDEPDLCWALERILRADGLAFSTASNGAAALDLIREQPFCVAFIDAILPDINGIRLAEQIQGMSPCTALVMMSGYYYPDDQRLSDMSIVGFLAKPFLGNDVRTILQQALSADRCRKEDGLCNEFCSSMTKTTCSG